VFERRGGPSPSSAHRISLGHLSIDRSREVRHPLFAAVTHLPNLIFILAMPFIGTDKPAAGHFDQPAPSIRPQVLGHGTRSGEAVGHDTRHSAPPPR
jgi:hypothetical protein